jgi:hypothetical protein
MSKKIGNINNPVTYLQSFEDSDKLDKDTLHLTPLPSSSHSIVLAKEITNFLLTERKVFTEKYRTEVFFVQTEPVGRGCTKRPRSDISL